MKVKNQLNEGFVLVGYGLGRYTSLITSVHDGQTTVRCGSKAYGPKTPLYETHAPFWATGHVT